MNFSEKRMLEMPLAKLYQFAHCALLFAGCATRWSHRTADEDNDLKTAIKKLKEAQKQNGK